MAPLPPVPRLPLIGDPLRRIRVPKDLDAVTHVGVECDPVDAGMTRDQVEAIWRSARRLYRSGVHPALQLCVRRDGHVVLDRAIGHARGNGPSDGRDAERLATFEALNGPIPETYRLEPRLGIASWLRDFLDPQLRELTSATGPFAQCTEDRHSPAKALRTEQPPQDYLDDL